MENLHASIDQLQAAANSVGGDVIEGAHNIKASATAEIKNLIADVEELVVRIADLKDADIARIRNKVLSAIDSAKEGLSGRVDNVRRQAQLAATSTDDYVHDSPWQALGIAALVGAVVGILATRRS